MIAAAIVAVTMTAAAGAEAGSVDVYSYGGWMKCSEVDKDNWVATINWVLGFWSGANANGPNDDALVGRNLELTDLERAFAAECLRDGSQSVQNAASTLYEKMRDGVPIQSSSNNGGGDVVATYDAGSYVIDGTVNGRPLRFTVDTGATGTVLNRSFALSLGPLRPMGTVKSTLADGRVVARTLYLVRSVCVSSICASSLTVTLENGGSLLGTDFLEAAHASIAVKDRVMTITGN
jgi:hypothetical protein